LARLERIATKKLRALIAAAIDRTVTAMREAAGPQGIVVAIDTQGLGVLIAPTDSRSTGRLH